ncbi:MAG TPA: choice-of-anchor D domain-containing protein [Candidatus Kapabacteria bacterium]|nr:choice-of-anchor D domain-containing protein [Candidatus Kapabacteria bacterium]
MLPFGTLRRLIPALLLGLWSMAAHAQLDPHGGGPNDPTLTPDTLRFNCVVVGETVSAPFTITNVTGHTVFVEEYRPGRLADPFSFSPRPPQDSIPDRKTVTDTIRFSPHVPGVYTASFKIHFGHGGSELTMFVRGVASVPPSVDVDGRILPFLPDVHAGESSTECIWLHNPSCREEPVTQLSIPGQDYSISSAPPLPFAIPGRDSVQICVRFAPRADGVHSDTLTIGMGPQRTQIALIGRQVQAGQPSLVIEPSVRVRMDSTFVGHVSAPQTILLYNVGDADDSLAPQQIILDGPDADQFTVTPAAIPGRILHADHADTFVVNVRFTPNRPGPLMTAFRLRHVDGNRPPVMSPGIGGVGLLAAATGLPNAVTIGDSVEVGTTGEQDSAWQLRNDGNVPLEIDSVTIGGTDSAAFAVEGPSGSLPPGATFRYDVSFSPGAVRTYNAILLANGHYIDQNRQPRAEQKSVSVTGRGFELPQPDPRVVLDRSQYDFGCVPLGDTSTAIVFHISNNGTRAVTLKEYRLPPAFEGFGPRAGTVIDAGTTYTDSLRFAPKNPNPPDVGGEFRVDVEGGQGSPTTATLTAHVGPPLRPTFAVSLLTFPNVAPGDTSAVPDTAIINNRSCRTLLVTSVSGPATPAFGIVQPPTGSIPIPANSGGYPLAVIFTPPTGSSGDLFDTIVVHAANGSRDTLALRGRADSTGRHGASIVSIAGAPVGFDTVIVALADTVTIRLVNRGDLDAQINADSLGFMDASVQDFQLLNRPSGTATLHAGAPDTLSLSVRFAPGAAGDVRNSLHVAFTDGNRRTLDIPLAGAGTPGPVIVPAAVQVPDVAAGDVAQLDNFFRIANAGVRGMTLERIELAGPDSAAFQVTPKQNALAPHDSIACSVRFAPDAVRTYSVGMTARFTNGLTAVATLGGNGILRPPAAEVITIDSASVNVNQKFTLGVNAYPPLTQSAAATDLNVKIHVDPDALFLYRVIPAAGATDSIGFSKDNDTIFIVRHASAPMAGNPLIALEMEGLVTGRPKNTVGLLQVAMPNNGTTAIGELRDGLVALSGCEIAHPVSFSRPVAAKLIYPMPARDRITIRYHAAPGSYPTMEIINVTGITVRSETLPAGTGQDQEVVVALAGLPAGMYYVRLRTATVQSVLPVLVTG